MKTFDNHFETSECRNQNNSITQAGMPRLGGQATLRKKAIESIAFLLKACISLVRINML